MSASKPTTALRWSGCCAIARPPFSMERLRKEGSNWCTAVPNSAASPPMTSVVPRQMSCTSPAGTDRPHRCAGATATHPPAPLLWCAGSSILRLLQAWRWAASTVGAATYVAEHAAWASGRLCRLDPDHGDAGPVPVAAGHPGDPHRHGRSRSTTGAGASRSSCPSCWRHLLVWIRMQLFESPAFQKMKAAKTSQGPAVRILRPMEEPESRDSGSVRPDRRPGCGLVHPASSMRCSS